MADLMNSSATIDVPINSWQPTGPNPGSKEWVEQNFGNTDQNFANLWNNIKDWWSNSALNPGTWQKKLQDTLGSTLGLNSAASQGKIAYTDKGTPYDATNTDSQINAILTDKAYARDDTAYTRLIADLKSNGINPAVLMSGASPFSSDAGYRSNYNLTTKDQVNSALKVATIVALLMRFMAK